LQVERPGGAPWRTIGVVAVEPEGLAHRLFDADPRLPWLAGAASPEAMHERFAALLEDRADAALGACAITPVRYKPGARCVLRYDLRTPSGPLSYWGKLLAQDGQRLQDTLMALHEAGRATAGMPRVTRPLAYWPDLHLLVQPAVAGGAELHARAFDPAEDSAVRVGWLRDAGARLAALHASAAAEGPRRTFADEVRELRAYSAPVEQLAPALGARFEAVLEVLAALERGRAEPAPVASHGAFRTDHLLLGDDGLVMIDLDGFCWANPARDVGNFLAYLRWKAMRQPQHAPFIERAARAFLEGYGTVCPGLDEDWLGLYQAAALLKIAGRRFRGLNVAEWPLVPRLLDEALATACSSAGLPLLRAALDGERMSGALGPVLRPLVRDGQGPTVSATRLLTYQRDSRGLVRYELAGTVDGGPRMVFGKLYREPGQATRVYGIMRALWEDVYRGAAQVGVPRPLGCLPELGMLVYRPVEGQLLDEVLATDEAPYYMDLAATWLGALHTCQLSLDRRFQMASELANLQAWAALVDRVDAGGDETAARLARRLAECAGGLRLEKHVPIHKDFHYGHLVVDQGLTVIDFDEMRLGDPSFDLAHFCANFDLLAHRQGGSPARFAALRGAFLDAYARHTGWAPDERFSFFYAYTCVKIARQLCTMHGPRPWPVGEERRRQVRLVLERGHAALARGAGPGDLP
jgi:aminoglycoside phosphotransferase (APT) family kinase protein